MEHANQQLPNTIRMIDPNGNPVNVWTAVHMWADRAKTQRIKINRFELDAAGRLVPIPGSAKWVKIKGCWSWTTRRPWIQTQLEARTERGGGSSGDLPAPNGVSVDDLVRRVERIEAWMALGSDRS